MWWAYILASLTWVREHIFATTGPNFTKFSARVTYGRGSARLRRRCDMLCRPTSGLWTSFLHEMASNEKSVLELTHWGQYRTGTVSDIYDCIAKEAVMYFTSRLADAGFQWYRTPRVPFSCEKRRADSNLATLLHNNAIYLWYLRIFFLIFWSCAVQARLLLSRRWRTENLHEKRWFGDKQIQLKPDSYYIRNVFCVRWDRYERSSQFCNRWSKGVLTLYVPLFTLECDVICTSLWGCGRRRAAPVKSLVKQRTERWFILILLR